MRALKNDAIVLIAFLYAFVTSPIGLVAIISCLGCVVDIPILNGAGIGVSATEFGPIVYQYTLAESIACFAVPIGICLAGRRVFKTLRKVEKTASKRNAA